MSASRMPSNNSEDEGRKDCSFMNFENHLMSYSDLFFFTTLLPSVSNIGQELFIFLG